VAAGWQYLWRILLMAVLLCGSAFCSGSETAFFHLSRRQIALFSKSRHPTEKLIAEILLEPNRFLTTLLFGNMLVNVSFYALASVFSVKISHDYGPGAGSVCAAVFFLILVLFGEMLPKSLAYSNTSLFCRWASLPCWVALRILGPFLGGLNFFLVRPFCRLFLAGGSVQEGRPVNVSQLRILLNSSAKRGLISKEVNQLLVEVVKFGYLKVRHIMEPRVDMTVCEEMAPRETVRRLFHRTGKKKLPVYRDSIDNITGVLFFRDFLLHPDQPISALLRPVIFVPEQKTVESLLEVFRKQKEDFAIVVDEYGGFAGSVKLEDILEELVFPDEGQGGSQPIEIVGPLTYRLSAELPVHEWIEVSEMEPDHQRLTTVGGLVTALLGRIARPGDTVHWKNLEFTVEKVQKNRIVSLILSLGSTPAPEEKEDNP
jgi:CBS domain containing-hemolysin-like protein